MRCYRFHRRTTLIAVTVAATLATVVSCDAPAPSDDRDTEVTSTQLLTEREQDLLHDAEQLLTQSCMAARGFRTWPVPRRPLAEDRDFPYVIDDVRWASRHGYGSDIEARRQRLRTNDPNQRYFRKLPAADRQRAVAAYNGDRSAERLEVRSPNGLTVGRVKDGCTAQAQEELYGDLAAWFRADVVTGALPALRRQQVVSNAEFTFAVRKWSVCMRERGLRYPDPTDTRAAFLAPEGTTPTPARRRLETRTAVAEAECAHSSGLTSTAARLDRRYDAQLRAKYRNEIRDRSRMEHAALPRARALLTTDRTSATTTTSTNTNTNKE
ncbi:hypothetical protein ACKI1I_21395 [Streptomyces turgidiscabies]|uniref:Putative lipoprotein n=1 Tax=Streptomyces turgidiscabies (strain Car8) TaxID=698760 RepID=L7ES58_STRT8|nr:MULTISPECIES: hypothetical protein [Streptomyces]ELP61857.1 putative lipoprotein [Streptomyces turgidiscabies Car8]MDX3496530.1 hypothetical protein [Streptomyces turgidiscabies]GAQ72720.1 hypothetical protein T45_04475 [Streptomyces turgidiscabies]